jgi:mono/diheme cytochrome c family protein
MNSTLRTAIALGLGTLAAAGIAQPVSRGEMLYANHCIACHSTQMHWRDQRAATDWASLKAQVRRWQQAALLGWDDSDVVEVTRYLNERIYHFAPATGALTWLQPAPPVAPAPHRPGA